MEVQIKGGGFYMSNNKYILFCIFVGLGAFLIISPMFIPNLKSEMPLVYSFIKFFVLPSYIVALVGSYFVFCKNNI
ncbi:hypothetical protein COI92_06175 [Bacillus anthracis]|uniref:Uncharacterized protein n=3 Tax=Bacillus cereus group TaxID=86661 RepID=A0A242Z0J2_9BACI|nr:hypothetical protein bthur0001_55600 [Bacillus thuringiensis serovar tochigiensis BGSC 4Y1]OTW50891.1 hypothetical protein BK699_10120 [Bacillus thuringiensis serovar mexicanensis]OTX09576.1 hypothetical protein BK705_05165 [Bacillus thuringiensis serovar monterrey]OTX84976.1 hypothetical protein BK730_24725 [Bacillus wiedmannii]OTZ80829.1 hypothetical protein BK771_32360 [Bacillus thuringiensis serovar ostriniae]PEQ70079.1 hypothetical protein CN474_18080 [Bacillus thuringiensis]PFA92959.